MNIDIPTLVMAMLSEDFIFFNEDDIAWDEEKREHFFKGAQVNAPKAEMLDSAVRAFDFDGIAEFAFALQGILLGLEADKQLVVPRSMVAQGVRQGLPEGDLTGITLANLAACGHALKFAKQESDSYLVMYDVRLAQGIPCFFDLVARMLWDLREVEPDLSGKSFAIGFASCRNFDADQYFGDVGSPVVGAQEERCIMQVGCAPEINLDVNSSGSVEIRNSGVLDVENPDDDMANDVELFETLLAREASELPRCYAIEGTGYKGRAARVEAMKPGDPVLLRSDWQCEHFDPVGIEMFNAQGETLGYLSLSLSKNAPLICGFRQIACLLPYVRATVDSVTPVSQRGCGAKYPFMNVRLELEGGVLSDRPLSLASDAKLVTPDFFEECKLVLSLPANERNEQSILEGKATAGSGSPMGGSEAGNPGSEKKNEDVETSSTIDIESARQRGFTVIHEWTQMLAKYIEGKESEEKKLYSELSNLGIFEFGAKKTKRAEIDEVAASIYRWSRLPDAWEKVADWLRICDLANNYKNRERKFGKRVSEDDVEGNVRFVLSCSLILFRMKDLGRPVTNEEIGEFMVELTGDNCYLRRSNMMWLTSKDYVRRIKRPEGDTYELSLTSFIERPGHFINLVIEDIFCEWGKFDYENSCWHY